MGSFISGFDNGCFRSGALLQFDGTSINILRRGDFVRYSISFGFKSTARGDHNLSKNGRGIISPARLYVKLTLRQRAVCHYLQLQHVPIKFPSEKINEDILKLNRSLARQTGIRFDERRQEFKFVWGQDIVRRGRRGGVVLGSREKFKRFYIPPPKCSFAR